MVNSHKNKAVVDAVNALQGNFYSARNGGEDGEYLKNIMISQNDMHFNIRICNH